MRAFFIITFHLFFNESFDIIYVIYTYIINNMTSGCWRISVTHSTEVWSLSFHLAVRFFCGRVVNQVYKNAFSIKLCVQNSICKNKKLRLKNLTFYLLYVWMYIMSALIIRQPLSNYPDKMWIILMSLVLSNAGVAI